MIQPDGETQRQKDVQGLLWMSIVIILYYIIS